MERLSRQIGRGRVRLITLALIMVVQHGTLRSAQAQTFPTVGSDVFYTSYYDVATSTVPAASSYGGDGAGGAGDGIVRIINPTSTETMADDTLCAMIYVFDDIEQLQTCCGCPVSADGLRTFSVIKDLTADFGVNKGNMSAGVVKIISSKLNFGTIGVTPPNSVFCTGTTAGCCDPTGGGLNTQKKGTGTAIFPTSGLRAWMTHTEASVRTQPFGSLEGTSDEEFADAPLDSIELARLQATCAKLVGNGSGAGVCNCGDPTAPTTVPPNGPPSK